MGAGTSRRMRGLLVWSRGCRSGPGDSRGGLGTCPCPDPFISGVQISCRDQDSHPALMHANPRSCTCMYTPGADMAMHTHGVVTGISGIPSRAVGSGHVQVAEGMATPQGSGQLVSLLFTPTTVKTGDGQKQTDFRSMSRGRSPNAPTLGRGGRAFSRDLTPPSRRRSTTPASLGGRDTPPPPPVDSLMDSPAHGMAGFSVQPPHGVLLEELELVCGLCNELSAW